VKLDVDNEAKVEFDVGVSVGNAEDEM